MRPKDWIDLIEERIATAVRMGWETVEYGSGFWLMNDQFGRYSGIGHTAWSSFFDVCADAELWDEVSRALEREGDIEQAS